jgi:short-subunit dehydrogenase
MEFISNQFMKTKSKINKNVLVTGCSTGIGYETVTTLIDKGCRVYATARTTSDLEKLTALGARAYYCELTDCESIQACVDSLKTEVGSLDCLINNAAYGLPAGVLDLSFDQLRHQFDVNVFGTIELTRLLYPLLDKSSSPRIIFISSILGVITVPYLGAYCASKYAVETLASALRMELKNKTIKISMIRPGKIATPFHSTARAVFTQNIDKVNSPYYQSYIENLNARDARPDSKMPGLHPKYVVRVIEHIMCVKHPRIAYYVTWQARLLGRLRCVLPLSLQEFLISRFS